MKETVWRCTVSRQRVEQYFKKYRVGNVKTVTGGAELRILSQTPPTEDAVRVDATLEDAFLLYFGERAGDDTDAEM